MANRFWVGSSGVFSDTAHWASTSGGAGGQTVPSTADTVTVDGHASGLNGGTLTIDQAVTVISFTWSAAVGTIDNSGNFNLTLSQASGASFTGSGSSARTWIGGSGTYTLTGVSTTWAMTTVTGLTNPTTAFASASIVLSGNSTTVAHAFQGGGLTYGNVTFNGQPAKGAGIGMTGANTFAALTIGAPNYLRLPQATTQTVTSLVATGTAADPILIESDNQSGQATISDTTGTNTLEWCGLRTMAFTGGATFVANNSQDYGRNSGITINVPSVGGGGGSQRVISG